MEEYVEYLCWKIVYNGNEYIIEAVEKPYRNVERLCSDTTNTVQLKVLHCCSTQDKLISVYQLFGWRITCDSMLSLCYNIVTVFYTVHYQSDSNCSLIGDNKIIFRIDKIHKNDFTGTMQPLFSFLLLCCSHCCKNEIVSLFWIVYCIVDYWKFEFFKHCVQLKSWIIVYHFSLFLLYLRIEETSGVEVGTWNCDETVPESYNIKLTVLLWYSEH